MSNGEYGVIGPLLYLIKVTNLEVSDIPNRVTPGTRNKDAMKKER